MRLVLSGHKTGTSLHPPARIIKAYIEVLPGFNHVWYPGSLNATVPSQGYVLGGAPGSREFKWNAHSKDEQGGVGSLQLLGSSFGVNWRLYIFNNLPQQRTTLGIIISEEDT